MDELRRILRTTWGFDGFRPLQAEAMQAVVEGQRVVMVLLDSVGKYSRIGDAQRIRDWLAAPARSPARSPCLVRYSHPRIACCAIPLPRPATQSIQSRWVAGRGSGPVPNRNSLFREFRS